MVHGADDDDNSKQQVSEDPQDSAGELIELALQFLGHPIDLGHLIDLGQASSKLQKSVDTLLSKLDSLGRIPSLSRESYERICQQDIRGDNVLLAAVLCELAVDCQPITLRGLFYRAVRAGMFPSTDKEYYNRVGRLVTQLRRRGLAWNHEQTCMACHTTGVYMAERTQLTTWFGPPREEIRAAFVADVPSAESLKVGLPNRPHGFPVWRSLGLAQWDRHVTGKLSHATDVSLREMLLRLPEEGLYKTVDKVEIPYTTTGFELSVQAARALAAAPGWVDGLAAPDLQTRLTRLKKALAAHQPRNDHERVLQLQLATAMPELVPQEVRDANLAMLREKQHSDGGWSTRDMSPIENWGDKIRPDNIAMLRSEPDAEQPASDAYMTAISVILMRENGVKADDPSIRRAVDWLKSDNASRVVGG